MEQDNSLNQLKLTITSEEDNIDIIECFTKDIIQKLQIPEKLHTRIGLSVIEVVVNSIFFGNKEDSQKTIEIIAAKQNTKVVITIKEEIQGIDFDKLLDPTDSDELMEVAHRGCFSMVGFPDELTFLHNGSKVIMKFFL